LKLDDLGISKKESARAQEFASVSEEEFEQILGASGSEELNDVALLRKINATRMRKAGPRAKNAPVPAPPPATPTPQAGAPATLPPLQVPELPFDTKNELLGDFAVFLKKLQKKFPGLSPAQFGALFYEWTSYRDRIERKLTDSGTL